MKIISDERLSGILAGLKYRLQYPDQVEKVINILNDFNNGGEFIKGAIYSLEWSKTATYDEIISKHNEADQELNKRIMTLTKKINGWAQINIIGLSANMLLLGMAILDNNLGGTVYDTAFAIANGIMIYLINRGKS